MASDSNVNLSGSTKAAQLIERFGERGFDYCGNERKDLAIWGKARGAIVVIEAEHLCMTMRGVRKPGSKTVTSAVRGSMHNAATRSEAMSLIMHSAR